MYFISFYIVIIFIIIIIFFKEGIEKGIKGQTSERLAIFYLYS